VLEDYERAGGRILIFANPGKPEGFRGVLEPYGVSLEAARIEDPGTMHPGQPNPFVLLSNRLVVGNHDIDRPIGDRIGIYVGTTRPLKIEDLKREGAERVVLLKVSGEAIAVPIEYREQSGEPDFIYPAKRSARDAPIAAALRRPAPSGKETRVVVFGSWEVASPAAIGTIMNFGNRDLLLNALNWIADRRSAIGIVEREIAASRVELTPGFLATFRWITMAGLPALIVIGGVLSWLGRRN
jgi:hypothetical protein